MVTTGASDGESFGFRTRSVHAGGRPDPTTGARAVPIYQTTSFVFEDALDASTLFALQKFGNIYSRIGNPTVAAFEERMASLEGGLGAVATSSGQSAELLVFIALAGAGDHVVASSRLYGGTRTLLDVTLRRLGVETTFVDGDDPEDFAAAITARTRAVYTEVIGNPSGAIADLAGLAAVAHDHGAPLVVDATLATPFLCRPIEHGADIVVHSATKFLGGHGTSIGGVVVESGRFDWAQRPLPVDDRSCGLLRRALVVGQLRRVRLPDPAEGRTATRRRRHHDARSMPSCSCSGWRRFRCAWPPTSRTRPPSPRSWNSTPRSAGWRTPACRPRHGTAGLSCYLPRGPGAVFSFGVTGGRAAGERFIGGVQLASHLANVGDAKTLVIHPASTTHAQLDDAALAGAGVSPELIRISVGIEDRDDICRDLDRALAVATGP